MSSGAEKDLRSTGVTTFDKWLRFCREHIAAKVSTIDAQCPDHPQLRQQGSLQAEPSTTVAGSSYSLWPATTSSCRTHGPWLKNLYWKPTAAVGSQRSSRGKWSQCWMAVYSSGFLYFATLFFAWCHFMQGGRDGQICCPCIVKSWRNEKWKSKDYFKAMLMKKMQTVTVLVYISMVVYSKHNYLCSKY